MIGNTSIKITKEKLDLNECNQFVEDPACGGVAVFIGTVRNATQNKEMEIGGYYMPDDAKASDAMRPNKIFNDILNQL